MPHPPPVISLVSIVSLSIAPNPSPHFLPPPSFPSELLNGEGQNFVVPIICPPYLMGPQKTAMLIHADSDSSAVWTRRNHDVRSPPHGPRPASLWPQIHPCQLQLPPPPCRAFARWYHLKVVWGRGGVFAQEGWVFGHTHLYLCR